MFRIGFLLLGISVCLPSFICFVLCSFCTSAPNEVKVNIHRSPWPVMYNSHTKPLSRRFQRPSYMGLVPVCMIGQSPKGEPISAPKALSTFLVFPNMFYFHFNDYFPLKLQALNTTEHKYTFFIFFTINNFQVSYWWTFGRWNGCQSQGPGNHGATDRY